MWDVNILLISSALCQHKPAELVNGRMRKKHGGGGCGSMHAAMAMPLDGVKCITMEEQDKPVMFLPTHDNSWSSSPCGFIVSSHAPYHGCRIPFHGHWQLRTLRPKDLKRARIGSSDQYIWKTEVSHQFSIWSKPFQFSIWTSPSKYWSALESPWKAIGSSVSVQHLQQSLTSLYLPVSCDARTSRFHQWRSDPSHSRNTVWKKTLHCFGPNLMKVHDSLTWSTPQWHAPPAAQAAIATEPTTSSPQVPSCKETSHCRPLESTMNGVTMSRTCLRA